jgi:RNA polymerase sigma factor (sigma-70 family)
LSCVGDIFHQLSTGQFESGWCSFLTRYSDLLYSTVLQYENDEFRAEDCYLHVCAKLSDDSFARLLQFQPGGPAKFETWLTVVASNLCIDWRRIEYGRFRAFRVINELSELEQRVFENRYKHGMPLHECFLTLKAINPGLTNREFSDINRRLNQLLSSKQHWRLGASSRLPVSEDESRLAEEILPSHEEGPEKQLQDKQDNARLEEAMSKLDPLQRRLIRLRYQHDLTLKEVAHLTGLNNLHAARRKLELAVAALSELMES